MTRIVGILGGSGAGKSSLAAAVRRRADAAVLSQDSYYRDLSHLDPPERAAANFDEPGAVDLRLLADHLEALKAGRAVRPPRYDMSTHTRAGPGAEVRPAPLVLLEGTILLAEPRVAAALDLVVYVDLPDGDRLARRIERDVSERGRSEASAIEQWEATVLPMHRVHVEPVRETADLVVSGAEPAEVAAVRVLDLLG
ncbi:MAG: uridine kinase [Planctomycetota bacterium]